MVFPKIVTDEHFSCLTSYIKPNYPYSMPHTYIVNNVKALRKSACLRQQDLAVELGIAAFDRISRWEMGLAYPSVQHLARLMQIFNVQPEEIYPELFGAKHPNSQYAPESPASDPDGVSV
jgi:DNA-binding XRE family transcriptional regulator